jgi:membrane protease YdiL (CAAX protease family)
MTSRTDPIQVAIRVAVYIVLFLVAGMIFGWMVLGLGFPLGSIAATVLATIAANWVALRIFEGRHLADAGLWWNAMSSKNLAIGLLGGAGSAVAVLVPPLIAGASHMIALPAGEGPTFLGAVLYTPALLVAGVFGEELLFRGYAFQVLLRAVGPYATILPVSVAFGLMHGGNLNVTRLAMANTAAFGIVFGYAYLRSRDLWLPIGLHLGWNFTLPLFGVNLSGFRMRMTGYEMSWTAGALWSGGEYGPEASVLTSAVCIVLFFVLWKAPIRRQSSPISDPPVENAVCEPSPRLPS